MAINLKMDCSGNDCLPWITLEFFIILSLVKDFFY